MRKQDRKPFAAALGATFTLYGQTISGDIIQIWWNVLDGYKIDAVLSALSYHVADYQGYGHRLPTPADVRRHLEITLPRLANESSQPKRIEFQAMIAEIDEAARVVAFNRRANAITVERAALELDALSKRKKAIQANPEYIAAHRPLDVHDDEATTAAVQRDWVPPFLRRGISVLIGKQV